MDTAEFLPTVTPASRFELRLRSDTATLQRLAIAGFWLVVVLSALVRLYNRSALWLDEAQSVAIARLPLSKLFAALRQDGSPPLYYLLLHYWIASFGQSAVAVRLLSTVVSLISLPVAYLAGRSWRDASTGRAAVLVLGVSPFAVRYATETRMYALLTLLALLLMWALAAAARRPTPARLAALAVLSGALALTHYWGLFFVAAIALIVLVRRQWRLLLGLAGGAVLFAPWLPGFLYQSAHTGTPWATPPSLSAIFDTAQQWSGGTRPLADLLFLVGVLLTVVAVLGRREGSGLALRWPPNHQGLVLFAAAFGSLLLGVLSSMVVRAGFPVRYSAAALGAGVLVVAYGVRVLPGRARTGALAVIAVLGLATSVSLPFQNNRTQAAATAAAIRSAYRPGDLVVFCPDQLGPAVTRLLPAGVATAVFPTLAPGDRVDWVDYQSRNEGANTSAIAAQVDARASGRIWLVWMGGYRTFGARCEQLAYDLAQRRSSYLTIELPNSHYDEPNYLIRYGPR